MYSPCTLQAISETYMNKSIYHKLCNYPIHSCEALLSDIHTN